MKTTTPAADTPRRRAAPPRKPQSALFNFQSLLVVILLVICTCAYVHAYSPRLLDSHKKGFRGLLWKSARVGERLSPWVAACCVAMAVHTLFFAG